MGGMKKIMMGININDKTFPFTILILEGIKTIETRNSPSLSPYIGKRVGIVRTGVGAATLIGYCTVGEPKVYTTDEAFEADLDLHQVVNGYSKYDFKHSNGVKYGYPLLDVKRCKYQIVTTRGIIARKVEDERF